MIDDEIETCDADNAQTFLVETMSKAWTTQQIEFGSPSFLQHYLCQVVKMLEHSTHGKFKGARTNPRSHSRRGCIQKGVEMVNKMGTSVGLGEDHVAGLVTAAVALMRCKVTQRSLLNLVTPLPICFVVKNNLGWITKRSGTLLIIYVNCYISFLSVTANCTEVEHVLLLRHLDHAATGLFCRSRLRAFIKYGLQGLALPRSITVRPGASLLFDIA